MSKIKISGISTPFGIHFIGPTKSMQFNNNGEYKITDSSNSDFLYFLDDIPFLRGIKLIFNYVISTVKEFTRLNIFLGVFIFYGFFQLLFINRSEVEYTTLPFWVTLVVFLVVFLFFYYTRENHAIEHKMIGAHCNPGDMTYHDVTVCPKENVRCGGVLLPFIFLLAHLFNTYFVLPYVIQGLIVISISVECFYMARFDNFVGKLFYLPGYLIQKLTTTNKIREDRLRNCYVAFKKFLHEEANNV